MVEFALSTLVAQGFAGGTLTWHCSSGHAEAASHIPQPEALTTRRYNYVPGGFGEKKKKKKKDWQQMLAQVSVFKKKDLLGRETQKGFCRLVFSAILPGLTLGGRCFQIM